MEMPERLRRRPQFKGYPVPYIVLIRPDGTPDFRVANEERRDEVIGRRLCHLCGEPLGWWIAFIGGPSAIAQRLFYDPAMHPECARYAVVACPFLRGDTDYAPVDQVAAVNAKAGIDGKVVAIAGEMRVPEGRVGILLTRNYRVAVHPGGETYVLADPPKAVEWYQRPAKPGQEAGNG